MPPRARAAKKTSAAEQTAEAVPEQPSTTATDTTDTAAPAKRKAEDQSASFGPAKDSVTKDGVTVKLPEGWKCHDDSILVWEFQSPKPSASVAGYACLILCLCITLTDIFPVSRFDFDGCLANTPLAGFDPNAWKPMFPNVYATLTTLHAKGAHVLG
jgi:hypothetical protein